jgi:hypothetical protein
VEGGDGLALSRLKNNGEVWLRGIFQEEYMKILKQKKKYSILDKL